MVGRKQPPVQALIAPDAANVPPQVMPVTEYDHRIRVTRSPHRQSLAPDQTPDCCRSEEPMALQIPALYALELASAAVADKSHPAAFDIQAGHEASWRPPDDHHRQRGQSSEVQQLHAPERARQNGYVRLQRGFPGCAVGQVRRHPPTAAAFQAAVAERSIRPGR